VVIGYSVEVVIIDRVTAGAHLLITVSEPTVSSDSQLFFMGQALLTPDNQHRCERAMNSKFI